jgi:WD40 repeat protein/predicted Ser/Thr protein kinase
MPNVPESPTCSKCGRVLPTDAPQGLCTKCLFGLMLAGGPVTASPELTSSGGELPRMFGDYELIEEIARGGMGIVYSACQVQLNRMVAVKVMAAGKFAAPDFVKRFRTEAEAAASLDHPNIVPIYEVGEIEGQSFFSMKFFEGGSLAQRRAAPGTTASSRDAVVLLAKVARAVHFAHQRGILHRDLKPGNVLLDLQGEPYLADFGLAKLVEQDNQLTRTLAMLGTPSYMPPEQARGETEKLTTAADVYGLGAVFYELLTGQPPFAGGTTMETVRQVLEMEPRRPSVVQPGLDRDLETICLKCLEKDPNRRYASAEALADDLERWQRHEPIAARPPSAIYVLKKMVRRNKGGAAALGAIVLLLVAGVVISSWQARQQRTLRGQAEENERAALAARREANLAAEQRRQQLVRLHVAAGNKMVDDGDAFMGLLRFVEALRLEAGDPLREDVHRRRFATVLRISPRVKQFWTSAGLTYIGLSPDGTRVVCGEGRGGAQVFEAENGTPVGPALKSTSGMRSAWFTPDGRFIATLDAARELRHWPVDRSEPASTPATAVTLRRERGEPHFVDYSADGRICVAASTRGVQVFAVATGEPVGPLLGESAAIRRVRLSADGKLLAISAKRPSLRVVEPSSGRQLWVLERPEGEDALAAFSPDGRRIVTSSGIGGKELDIWDSRRGERLVPTIQVGSVVGDLQVSADNNWVAALTTIYVRSFDARTGVPALQPMWHGAQINRMQAGPTGHWLATASFDQTVRIWDAASGKLQFPALRHAGTVGDVQTSRQGGRLATSCIDGTVRLWDLPSGHGERRRIASGIRGRFRPRFSADGRRLLVFGEKRLARLWDSRAGTEIFALDEPANILDVSLSQDGSRLAVAGADGHARIWNTDSSETVFSLPHAAAVREVEFSPDGTKLLTGSEDWTARVWNSADGMPAGPILPHPGPVLTAAFSPNGRQVIAGCEDGSVYLWDAISGQTVNQVKTPSGTNLTAVAINADGRRLLSVSSGRRPTAQLWDAATGRPVGPEVYILSGVSYPATFTPDGKRYLVLHDATSVAIMDAETGARATPLLRHERLPVWFEFSPDGRMVLTCEDVGARLWDTETGEPVTPPLRNQEWITGGSWSADGREVATTAFDGVVQFWDVSPDESSVAELERKAELLAAHRLDPQAGAIALRPEEMKKRWQAGKPAP